MMLLQVIKLNYMNTITLSLTTADFIKYLLSFTNPIINL